MMHAVVSFLSTLNKQLLIEVITNLLLYTYDKYINCATDIHIRMIRGKHTHGKTRIRIHRMECIIGT